MCRALCCRRRLVAVVVLLLRCAGALAWSFLIPPASPVARAVARVRRGFSLVVAPDNSLSPLPERRTRRNAPNNIIGLPKPRPRRPHTVVGATPSAASKGGGATTGSSSSSSSSSQTSSGASSSSSSQSSASADKEQQILYEGPQVPVAINGGDEWIGFRVTSDALAEVCEAATSTAKPRPVMKQFHPRRSWLWKQWHGTIVRSVLRNEVKLNMAWALIAVTVVWHVAPRLMLLGAAPADGAAHIMTLESCRAAVVAQLRPVENFWALTQTLVAFVLSFFLSQTYAVWREVYSIARRVQGRLSDLGLLLATNAEREAPPGGFIDGTTQTLFYGPVQPQNQRPYTERASDTLAAWARYARLFNMLFFASVTRRFAPLATPKGLQALRQTGAITKEEVDTVIETTSWHQTVALWMSTLVANAVKNGSIRGGASVAYQASTIFAQMRQHYGQMGDALSGRMPLAYTHLVQLFVDALCLAAPLALIGPLGFCGAIAGTGLVTLFYAGVLALAKMFLDPFDNEDYGGRSGIRLEADTLVQEVNALTRRWTTAARRIPSLVHDPSVKRRTEKQMLEESIRFKAKPPVALEAAAEKAKSRPSSASSSGKEPETSASSSSSNAAAGTTETTPGGVHKDAPTTASPNATSARKTSARPFPVASPSMNQTKNYVDVVGEEDDEDDEAVDETSGAPRKRPPVRNITTKVVKREPEPPVDDGPLRVRSLYRRAFDDDLDLDLAALRAAVVRGAGISSGGASSSGGGYDAHVPFFGDDDFFDFDFDDDAMRQNRVVTTKQRLGGEPAFFRIVNTENNNPRPTTRQQQQQQVATPTNTARNTATTATASGSLDVDAKPAVAGTSLRDDDVLGVSSSPRAAPDDDDDYAGDAVSFDSDHSKDSSSPTDTDADSDSNASSPAGGSSSSSPSESTTAAAGPRDRTHVS